MELDLRIYEETSQQKCKALDVAFGSVFFFHLDLNVLPQVDVLGFVRSADCDIVIETGDVEWVKYVIPNLAEILGFHSGETSFKSQTGVCTFFIIVVHD